MSNMDLKEALLQSLYYSESVECSVVYRESGPSAGNCSVDSKHCC